MESDDGSSEASSRWNPTKEQRRILENLYEQGIKTPTAHQIQHITATLRTYSHIQPKNVFYWFQNHKARQRQKQKQRQQSIAYFNRLLHMSHPIFPSPLCSDVICASYHHPVSEMSLCPQQKQQRIPEELALFPLHPTGVLEGKTKELQVSCLSSFSAHTSISTTAASDSSDIDEHFDARPGNQPFFDFLSLGQGFPTK